MLTARYVANGPTSTTTSGAAAAMAGLLLTFQSRNRAIVFAKPHGNRDRFLEAARQGGLSRLATVIGLWNFASRATGRSMSTARKIEAFPHRVKAGQRILIRDGVSYLAILPLPATDLGRDAEIEIGSRRSPARPSPTARYRARPHHLVVQFQARPARTGRRPRLPDVLPRAPTAASCSRWATPQQHGSFEAFARHIRPTGSRRHWHEDKRLLEVAYRSGSDLMEAGFTTDFGQPSEAHFADRSRPAGKGHPVRRLNGQWPYLPPASTATRPGRSRARPAAWRRTARCS